MPGAKTSPRIPAELQAIILASNRGVDLDTLKPPTKVASDDSSQCSSKKGVSSGIRTLLRKGFSRRVGGGSKLSTSGKDDTSLKGLQDTTTPTVTPQDYLEAMISLRGYSTKRIKTIDTAYYNKPTTYQLASYNTHLCNIVRDRKVDAFRAIMASGISPNPCNEYSESLMHTVCRRGDFAMMQVLLEHGARAQVSDDYGRTALHDACWATKPAFGVVEALLKVDKDMLFMLDQRDALPLSYVSREHWTVWIEWLDSKRDVFWPASRAASQGQTLRNEPPNSCPIPDPKEALTLELARMVSSGRMLPEEAKFLNFELKDPTGSEFSASSNCWDFYASSDDEYDDDDSAEEHTATSFLDGKEFEEVLKRITSANSLLGSTETGW